MAGKRGRPQDRWSKAFKRRVVAESAASSVSASEIAWRNGLNLNLIFSWHKKYGAEVGQKLTSKEVYLVSVEVKPKKTPTPHGESCNTGYGFLEIDLPCGTRVWCGLGANPELLGQALVNTDAVYTEHSPMIPVPSNSRVWLAAGVTDMRNGFNCLSMLVQKSLLEGPFSGLLFVFRGRRGGLLETIRWDGQGACLFTKRLKRVRFVWPRAEDGKITLNGSQVSMLLGGIDWRIQKVP